MIQYVYKIGDFFKVSFARKSIQIAAVAAASCGVIQGAGEIGEWRAEDMAVSSIDDGSNVIACVNAVETGPSDFSVNADGNIIGVRLDPNDMGRPTFGKVDCNGVNFVRQVSSIPDDYRKTGQGLITAANRGLIDVSAAQSDAETTYERRATTIVLGFGLGIGLGKAIVARRRAAKSEPVKIVCSKQRIIKRGSVLRSGLSRSLFGLGFFAGNLFFGGG
jgi:hypothetical protein